MAVAKTLAAEAEVLEESTGKDVKADDQSSPKDAKTEDAAPKGVGGAEEKAVGGSEEKSDEITFPVVFQKDLANNEYPGELIEWIKNNEAGKKNLCAKYCTPEQWKEYADKQTKIGFQFRDAINTGLKNPTSYVGCHFGDLESYTMFKTFYDNVLMDYHKITPGADGKFEHPIAEINIDDLKVDIEDKDIVKSTRVRCARNLIGDKHGDFGMAPGMKTVSMKLAVEAVLIEAFKQLEGDLAGTYYSLDPDRTDVPVLQGEKKREYIVDKHMLCKSTDDQMQVDSGYHKWFPKGRGFYVSHDEKFCCWINEGDHLRVISMQPGGDVKEVLARWIRGVIAIEAAVKHVTGGKGFMQVPGLGYFACCPSNLGTGTRASVHIPLPKLLASGRLGELALKMKLQMRGVHGEHSEADAEGRVGISNKFRLGYTEIQLATFMISGLNTLVSYEKRLASGEDVSILQDCWAEEKAGGADESVKEEPVAIYFRRPPPIYHIVAAKEWAGVTDEYVNGLLKITGKTYCCAKIDMLLVIANTFFKEVEGDFVCLKIDPKKLKSKLIYEAPDPGPDGNYPEGITEDMNFPHVYGSIQKSAVAAVLEIKRQEDGTFEEVVVAES